MDQTVAQGQSTQKTSSRPSVDLPTTLADSKTPNSSCLPSLNSWRESVPLCHSSGKDNACKSWNQSKKRSPTNPARRRTSTASTYLWRTSRAIPSDNSTIPLFTCVSQSMSRTRSSRMTLGRWRSSKVIILSLSPLVHGLAACSLPDFEEIPVQEEPDQTD